MSPVYSPPNLVREVMYPLGIGGETNFSRDKILQNSTTLTSGVIFLGPANVAQVTETISHVSCVTGATAAATTTYAAYAVYTVDASGNLTLIASSTNNTSLWNSAFQGLFGVNVKQALTASFVKQAGVTYCVGALFVGTTAPTIGANTPSSGEAATNLLVPMRGAKSAGSQTSVVTTGNIAVGSLVSSSFAPFFALLTA